MYDRRHESIRTPMREITLKVLLHIHSLHEPSETNARSVWQKVILRRKSFPYSRAKLVECEAHWVIGSLCEEKIFHIHERISLSAKHIGLMGHYVKKKFSIFTSEAR